ncbi:hypothetical protein K2173_016199 [Erythroxylum novogranatense]|uniref:RNA-dependent RNA polymerase n=1 Tax=Erythroxylum novogranatense TaxID=1862640 RepID=A0AAV8SFS3_9ROSI|nr:hypothetical protein K2173_016199 [Erythroxylum novogranatense]
MGDSSPQLQVVLPLKVDELIERICDDQSKPQLGFDARQKLASLTEEAAVAILQKISRCRIQTFDGFVKFMVDQELKNGSPSSSSPQRSSPSQNRVPKPTIPFKLSHGQKSCSSSSSSDSSSSSSSGTSSRAVIFSPQLQALWELEFRKVFLILSYLGGLELEDFLSPENIRSLKDLPMQSFETQVWEAVGCKCGFIKENDRLKYLGSDRSKTYSYNCHVYPDGSYKFKGPFSTTKNNFLQRALGDDNVLMVKFEKITRSSPDFAPYEKLAKGGIILGLRCYHFFVYKDGGKEEKKKDPTTSPVKCYFVRTESYADEDNESYVLNGKTIREARSMFMHLDTLPNLSKYMARFQLILSNTRNLEIDLSSVTIKPIDDVPCRDRDGNFVLSKDDKLCIYTDGTGYISEDLALKCRKNVSKGTDTSAESNHKGTILKDKVLEVGDPPLLIQFRLFNNGSAVKGTVLLNKKLPSGTICVRRSMIKVDADPLLRIPTMNSLEIVGTSNRPRKVYLSKNLIALLSNGGVPKDFFMGLLRNALEDAKSFSSNVGAAYRVALNFGEMGDYDVVQMIGCGIPLEEPYLQYRLSTLVTEEKRRLKDGKIHVPESYYLMGTVDPTGDLESDEVCIILDHGHVSGKVLVYRNPGLHFGDVHIMKATHVKGLEAYVGNAKYAIFFPRKGSRSLADELAGGDFDGDMYFVSRNPQLLETFKQSEPWTSSSPIRNVPTKRPNELSDERLEEELFRRFLVTRFFPSYTVGLAADSWLAMMDRYLTLGELDAAEKNVLRMNMCQLIDLYYDALDAPKSGEKVEIPEELKAELFPHHMERGDKSYKSTSVLGEIYDEVKSYEDDADSKTIEVWKLPLFDQEVSDSSLAKWNSLYEQYRQEMSAACQLNNKEIKSEAADDIYQKYTEKLYEASDISLSNRTKKDIYDEALAIYHVAYGYAVKKQQPSRCGFAWKVAGSALCQLYLKLRGERPAICSLSALRGM